jgi:glycosyltransferase involved in cell wall biosynthesis
MKHTKSVDEITSNDELGEQNCAGGSSARSSNQLLTVAIPNYGYGRYIQQAIDSVVAQDYGSIELIVVDDGSKDDSVAIAEKALSEQDRLHRHQVIRLGENRGKLAALNVALEQTRGHYFIILDADDWLASDYASRCISELQQARSRDGSIGFVYTDCNLVEVDGSFIDRGRSVDFDADRVEHLSFLPEPAVTLTEAIKSAAPFDESIRRATKHHKWRRIVANGWAGHYVAEPLFYYRMHGHNMSGIGERVMSEAEAGTKGERILSGYWQVSTA